MKALCALAVLMHPALCADAHAQNTADGSTDPLTACIPAEASFYLEARKLSDLDAALTRTRAATLLPLLVGRPAPMGEMLKLRQSVAAMTGITQSDRLNQLMSCQAAYCAASWRDLEGAVLVIRLGEDSWLGEWFPPSARTASQRSGKTLSFETASLRVVARDRLVALSRKTAPASLIGRVKALLQEKKPSGWSADPVFKRLVAKGPSDPLVRVGLRRPPAEPVGAGEPERWNLGFDVAVLGVDEKDGQVDVSLHAHGKGAAKTADVSKGTLEVVRRLPASTLFAWASASDWKSPLRGWTRDDAGLTASLLDSLNARVPLRELVSTFLEGAGERSVLVWGRPLPGRPAIPQLGAFVECDEAREVARKLTEVLSGLLRPASTEDAPAEHPSPQDSGVADRLGATGLVLRFGDQLGTPITLLDWPTPPGGVTLGSRPAPGLTFAFAPIEGWLVFALSEDHLRSLLESHHAMRPALDSQRDVRGFLSRPSRSSTLSVAQPVLAAGVLTRWISDHQSGRESPFRSSWWLEPTGRPRLPRLGALVEPADVAGAVRVVEVDVEDPAAGLLQVDDWIIGVDGQLLALENTVEDASRRLTNSHRALGPVLRVVREGVFIDVDVPVQASGAREPLEKWIPTVRQLALMGQQIEFACFNTWDSPPDEYGARLMLQFVKTSR